MRYILILIFFITGCLSTPYLYNTKIKSNWPKKFGSGYYYVYNGTVQLKNNSKIVGLIKMDIYNNADTKLDSSTSFIQILPSRKTTIEDIQTIYLYEISYIRIQNPANSDSDEYKPFGSTTLAKLIGKKNDVRLYCRYSYWESSNDPNFSHTITGANIILTLNTKILAQFSTLVQPSQRWSDYSEFINKRYKQHFSLHYSEFKNEKEMIDYILNKEIERLNNQSKK
jgi:hypothetical protein